MSVPHGFNNSTLYCTNVDFRGVLPVVDQMVADGQLLIGSAAAPQIRAGSLTSVDTSVTITVGPGTIDLSAAPIITGDIGTASGPNLTIFTDQVANAAGASVLFSNSGSTSQLILSDGSSNIFLGGLSGNLTLNGPFNTATGVGSLPNLTSGQSNCAFGFNSLPVIQDGIGNIGIGYQALDSIVSGTFNIGFGFQCGDSQAGSDSSCILMNSFGIPGVSNLLQIGAATGNAAQQLNTAYIHGIYSTSQDPSATVEVVTINNTSGLLGVTTLLTGAIQTINGDSGSITGTTVTVFTNQAANNAGSTFFFDNTGTTSTLNVSDTSQNTFIGFQAGSLAGTPTQSTGFGYQALALGSAASGCTAVGSIALANNVSFFGHTAVGTSALNLLNGSVGITAMGYGALGSTVDDVGNSAFGYQCLSQLGGFGAGSNANFNCGFGFNVLLASFVDTDNCGFGYNALTNTQGGSFNCAYGSQSMQGASPSQATRNAAFGYQTLFSSTTGCNSNVAVGAQSLYSIVSNAECVAIGDGALQNLNGVDGITAVGYQALFNSVLDGQNVAIGYQAMYSTNSGGMGGNANTASGYQVMYSNVNGSQCLSSGFQALYSATTPNSTVAEGFQAMYGALTPVGCTATGFQALYSSQNDQYHCAYGDSALYSVNGSNNCSAFGTDALGSLVTGQNSTALGCFALSSSVNAEGNLGLGYNAGTNIAGTDAFNVFIASIGVSGDNGVIRIGDTTGTPAQNQFQATYICGINNFTQDPLIAGPQVVTIDPTTNRLGVTAALSGGIQTINTDVGSVTGTTITLYANNAANDNGATVNFNSKTSTIIELQTTDSNGNTNIGKLSGNIANIGANSTSTGASSLSNITTGISNCAYGAQSMYNTLDGEYSSAYGFQSMFSGTSHKLNCAFGFQSLYSDTNGRFVTAIGGSALFNINGGQYTTAIGNASGSSYTSTESSNIVINSSGVVGESNTLRIGQGTGSAAQQLNQAFISGINGVTLGGTPKMVVIDSTTDQLAVQAIPSTQVQAVTPVTHAASPYTVLATDQFLSCATSGGVITLRLPNAPTTGQVWTIKDASGAAAASNITVTTVGGAVTIDGVTSYVLNVNYQSISVIFNGASYSIF